MDGRRWKKMKTKKCEIKMLVVSFIRSVLCRFAVVIDASKRLCRGRQIGLEKKERNDAANVVSLFGCFFLPAADNVDFLCSLPRPPSLTFFAACKKKGGRTEKAKKKQIYSHSLSSFQVLASYLCAGWPPRLRVLLPACLRNRRSLE